jgi:hypothetical protein
VGVVNQLEVINLQSNTGLSQSRGSPLRLLILFREGYSPTLCDNKSKECNKISEPKSPEILSTAQLISAVGQIWDCASHPLSFFQAKKSLNYNDKNFEKEEISDNLGVEGNGRVPTSADSNCICLEITTAGHISPTVHPNLDYSKGTQKMSIFDSYTENYTHSLFGSFPHGHNNMSNELWREKGLSSLKISYELGNIYGWRSEIIPAGVKHPVKPTEIEKKITGERCILGDRTSPASSCISGDMANPANLSGCNYDLLKCKDSSSLNTVNSAINAIEMTSLYKDYFLVPIRDSLADGGVSMCPSSSIYADYHIKSLASCNSAFEECQCKTGGNELPGNNRKQSQISVMEDEYKMKVHASAPQKPQYVLAKQEHAFAGALSGIFVSLCLHPVDTVKTVIQSCRAEQNSICYIGKSIVSDRGKFLYYT